MSDESGHILTHVEDTIVTITLNRPEKLNALTPAMIDRLEAVARDIDRDTAIRAIILTGAGDRAFSVGADIAAWSSLPPLAMWQRWVRDGHRVFDALATLRQPVIAALNGYTLGGGLELALAADIRIAVGSARFGSPEVKIGTLPGWAGTRRLPKVVGPARARHLILTGQQIDAETAERWGLITDIVADDALAMRAHELASEIAANAPVAVQLAKQVINALEGDSPAIALEAIAGALAATTDDGAEGVNAFKEKRAPRFKGS